MSVIKRLAGETMIYGLSSILGRFANFLLVPLYTWLLLDRDFGDIAWCYALMGFLKVLFTLQLDTALFRFGSDAGQRQAAYRTLLRPAAVYMVCLGLILFLSAETISTWLGYAGYGDVFRIMAVILTMDAFVEFPLARLRLEQRPLRFAGIRLLGISMNVIVNVALLLVLPMYLSEETAPWLYPERKVMLVLLANLAASAVVFLFVSPDIRLLWDRGERIALRPVLQYAWPLIFISFAGVINEMLDRQLLRWLLPGTFDEVRAQIGIYSANYRLAMVIALFTQAFRYAAEPFFFQQAKASNARILYARVGQYYTLASAFGFLVIALCSDWLKYFIGREGSSYHEGLQILPVLLLANLILGLYYNFSVWYKLNDRTRYGAWIAIIGVVITIAGNIITIPQHGYVAAAWVTLLCYAVMAVISYLWGRSVYPVPYPMLRMSGYVVSALLFAGLTRLIPNSDAGYGHMLIVGVIIFFWAGMWYWVERKHPVVIAEEE